MRSLNPIAMIVAAALAASTPVMTRQWSKPALL
jgi:hypothetical protein